MPPSQRPNAGHRPDPLLHFHGPAPGLFSYLEIEMSEHTTPIIANEPKAESDRLVIYGLDEAGRAHASQFAIDERDLVERAAAAMAMRVVSFQAGGHEALLQKVPKGKLFGSGKAFVPFTKQQVHDDLCDLARKLGQYREEVPPRPLLPATKPKEKPSYHSPVSWTDIKVGSLVLASEGLSKSDGWFEAAVVERKADNLFMVRWRDWPDEPTFARQRDHLALLPATSPQE